MVRNKKLTRVKFPGIKNKQHTCGTEKKNFKKSPNKSKYRHTPKPMILCKSSP